MNSEDELLSKQFCKFCIKVLQNEAKNIFSEKSEISDKEISLSELKDKPAELSSYDSYFEHEHIFKVLDMEIIVIGNSLAAAIKQLPKQRQDIILLSYFAGLSDREIGEKIGVVRQTVQYRRIISLKQLKKLLMKEYERNDEAF